MVSVKNATELQKNLENGGKFYLYGAGKVYRKIIKAVNDDIIAVIDRNYSNICQLSDKAIMSPESVFIKGTYDVICALDPTFNYIRRTEQLGEELSMFGVDINLYMLDEQGVRNDGVIVWGDKILLYDNIKYLVSGKSDFVRDAYLPIITADKEYLTKLNEEPCSFVLRDEGIGFEDFDNGKIKHVNGRKDWRDAEAKGYKNRVLFFGDSRVSGMLLENKNTIAAELQKRMNVRKLPYRVDNFAIPGRDIERMVWQIKNTAIDAGDIVVLGSGFYEFDEADDNAIVWVYYLEEACKYVKEFGASFFYMNLPTLLEVTEYSADEEEARKLFNTTEFLDYTPSKIKYYKNVIQMECASRGVCFIDMAYAFAFRKKYGQVWINLHHYGPHGSELIADELMDYLIPLLKYRDCDYLYESAIEKKEIRSREFENKLIRMKTEDEQIYVFADNLREKMEKNGERIMGC